MPGSPPKYPNDLNGESSLLSFVVHLWKEEATSEGQPASWRGHITPVPDGERHYFTNISEIPTLIAAHLKLQR